MHRGEGGLKDTHCSAQNDVLFVDRISLNIGNLFIFPNDLNVHLNDL